jgi:hypothetical protein
MVHNHGTEEWLGLACPERVIDGKSKGLCLVLGGASDVWDYRYLSLVR